MWCTPRSQHKSPGKETLGKLGANGGAGQEQVEPSGSVRLHWINFATAKELNPIFLFSFCFWFSFFSHPLPPGFFSSFFLFESEREGRTALLPPLFTRSIFLFLFLFPWGIEVHARKKKSKGLCLLRG